MTALSPTISVRELSAGDVYVLDTVFAGLSSHSRHMRFHSPVRRMTPSVRRILADVDRRDHVALGAFAGRRREPVGIVRMITMGGGRAELAVEVVDAWHGRGVGIQLLHAAKHHAAKLGHRELVAEVLAENPAVQSLLRSIFPGATVQRSGDEITMALPIRDVAGFDISDVVIDLVA
jgi:GNAT superfamily N-acetyltransferase